MTRIRVGSEIPVEVDACRRCGGLWLERGEVQRLRSHGEQQLRARHGVLRTTPHHAQCQACHAPLDRDSERCPACEHDNCLGCPSCHRTMAVVMHEGLRLDVCRRCQGSWFDHHELDALWGPRFDLALARRQSGSASSGMELDHGYLAGDVAFHAFYFAPDLAYLGGDVAAHVFGGVGEMVGQFPDVVAATPEAASGMLEVVGEAAADVFEAVLDIVAGVFS
jgi:Zn-finger nucleic acid-binding protein